MGERLDPEKIARLSAREIYAIADGLPPGEALAVLALAENLGLMPTPQSVRRARNKPHKPSKKREPPIDE